MKQSPKVIGKRIKDNEGTKINMVIVDRSEMQHNLPGECESEPYNASKVGFMRQVRGKMKQPPLSIAT